MLGPSISSPFEGKDCSLLGMFARDRLASIRVCHGAIRKIVLEERVQEVWCVEDSHESTANSDFIVFGTKGGVCAS